MGNRVTVTAGETHAILTVEHETHAAVLLATDGGKKAWLPLSQINRTRTRIEVSAWLASRLRPDQRALFGASPDPAPEPAKKTNADHRRDAMSGHGEGEYYG